MTYKHIRVKCCSLRVQVYTHVLMKSSSKQVFTTRSTKPKHVKNIHIKACKLNGSLEIVTKLYELFSKSPIHGPNILDSGASIVVSIRLMHHHQGTNPLTSCESPLLHQTQLVRILVSIFLGP